jgi:NADH-quinone oxidoreductase subunit L
MHELAHHWHGALSFALHGFTGLPFWLALAGVATAGFLYLVRTDLPARIERLSGPLHSMLVHKYGFDRFNEIVFAGGSRGIGGILSRVGDRMLIDGLMVNGSAWFVRASANVSRRLQTGYLYHYAFTMIVGLLVLLGYFVNGWLK